PLLMIASYPALSVKWYTVTVSLANPHGTTHTNAFGAYWYRFNPPLIPDSEDIRTIKQQNQA
ncbi:hypothetical protein QVM88_19310, partial [Providencia stuartii]|nr:hypothetical protein [Providencia stuartii]